MFVVANSMRARNAKPVLMQRNETEIYTFGLSLRSARPYNAYTHKHTHTHSPKIYRDNADNVKRVFVYVVVWWSLSTDNKKAANMRDIP